MFPDSFWTPLTCFTVIAAIYFSGECLSRLINGLLPGLIIATCIFMVGFWTGVLPPDLTTRTGLTTLMSNFGTALVITNLGTMFDMENICREWKTVVVSVSGFIGIAVACFSIGSLVFGQTYALAAAPPISGGAIAGVLVQTAANEAGHSEIAGFAMLVLAVQKFFGMPIASLCLRKEMSDRLRRGDFDEDGRCYAGEQEIKLPSMRLIPELPKKYMSNNMMFAALGLTATVAYWVGTATKIPGSDPANYYLNPSVAYLLFGILATRIGLLPHYTTRKAISSGLLSFGLMCSIPGSLAKISPSLLLEMLPKVAGLLAMSSVGICLVCILVGKLVGYTPWVSMACGCSCMLGYPNTELLTDEVIRSMEGATDEQRQRAYAFLMPKMVVAGFATVTVASVAFAGYIAPLIFS